MSVRSLFVCLLVFLGLETGGLVRAQALVATPSSFLLAAGAGSTTPVSQDVSLQNTGGAVNVGLVLITNAPWLTLDTSAPFTISGNSTKIVKFFLNPTGLEVGTYKGTVTFSPNGRPSTVVDVTFRIDGGIITLANASFSFQLNQGQTTTRTVSFSSTAGGTTTIDASSTGNWLSVNKTSTTNANDSVIATVNTAGLAPGTYPGTLRFSGTGGSPVLPKTCTITITVNTTDDLTVATTPSPVTFSDNVGSTGTKSATVNLTNVGSATTYTVQKTAAWLTLSKSSGSLALNGTDSFGVTINPTGLSASVYTDTVTVGAVGRQSRSFVVTLTMTTSSVTVTPLSLTFTAPTNSTSPTAPQSVTVSTTGPGVTYTVSKSAAWLVLSKTSGTVGANSSDAFTVTANPTLLPAGVYNDTILVSVPGRPNFLITVTFNVTGGNITLSLTSVTLSVERGASTTRSISLNFSGSNATLLIEPSSTPTWLSVNKTSTTVGAASPNDLIQATISAAALTAGFYPGSIRFSSIGPSPALPQTVAFSLTVTDTSDMTVQPSQISFSGTAGSPTPTPASQIVVITNKGAAVNYSVSKSQPWIILSKSSGTMAADGGDSFTIAPDIASVPTGTSQGQVTVSAPGRPDRSITVTVTVAPGVTDLAVQPSQLSFTGTANSPTSTPGPQLIAVTNKGAAVSYSISKSQPWIILSKSGGTLAAEGADSFTIAPDIASLSPGSAQGTVTVSAAGRPDRTISVSVNVSNGSPTQTLTVVPSKLFFFADPGQVPVPQLVTVTTSGSSSQTVNLSASSPSSWLQLGSNSTQAPGTFAARGLATSVFLPSNGEIQLSPSSSSVASATIPVTLAAPGLPVYTIPRVADGNFFATTITIVNRDVLPATVSLSFFKENGTGGTSPWVPDMEGNTPLSNVTIPVGASFTWQTRGVGTVGENGWALATCSQKISGFAVFRQTRPDTPSQEAAVPINSGWQQRFLLPFDNSGNITAVALSNVSSTESASITAIFKDEQGQAIQGTFTRTLPPLGHIAFALPSEVPALDRRRGTAEFFTTSGRLSSVGLRFSTVSPAFTSFEPQSLNIPVTGSLTIPQIADGLGEGFSFTTSITVVNNDVVPARVTLRFYQRNPGLTTTRAWSPTMQDNAPIDNVEIKAGASFTWRTRGIDPFAQGWAEVIAAERVSGFAIFQQRVPGRSDQEAAVPVNAGAQQRFLLPFDNTGKFATTMALANFSTTETAVINVVFRNAQNSVITSSQITLPARAHDAFSLFERFPALVGLRGVAEFTTVSGQVSPLGLRFSDIAFTSFRTQVF